MEGWNQLPADLQGTLLQMSSYITNQISQGNQINPDMDLSPSILQQFMTQASTEMDPYYQEQIKLYSQDINESIKRLNEDYQKEVQRSEEPYREQFQQQDIAEAEAGTAYSSGRQKREEQMVGQRNLQLQDLATQQ